MTSRRGAESPAGDYEYLSIPIENLSISAQNVRRSDVTLNVEDLARNIARHGLLQPIIVRRLEGSDQYEIIIGQRRYLALRTLRWTHIPARVVPADTSDDEIMTLSFSENVVRQDLDPQDKARVCAQLREKLGSVRAVAEELGVSENTVRKWIEFAEMPDQIQELVTQRKLTRGQASRIWQGVRDVDKAQQIANIIIQEQPPKEARERLFTAAEEIPHRPITEIRRHAEEVVRFREPISFVLPELYAIPMDAASQRLDKDPGDIARDATIEWLEQNEVGTTR